MGFLAIAAATSAAFNLVCSGYYHSYSSNQIGREAYSITYRISPDTREWCSDECSFVRPIFLMSRDEIALAYDKPVSGLSADMDVQIINRIGGTHYAMMPAKTEHGMSLRQWDGACQKQPFSGFPGKQKF